MTEMELVKALRACATYDDPDCRGYPMAPLASLSDEGKSCVDRLMEAAAEDIETMRADRDAWKHRCKAAERDIQNLLIRGGIAACHYCKQNPDPIFEKPLEVCKCLHEAEWRGPCAENGGVE